MRPHELNGSAHDEHDELILIDAGPDGAREARVVGKPSRITWVSLCMYMAAVALGIAAAILILWPLPQFPKESWMRPLGPDEVPVRWEGIRPTCPEGFLPHADEDYDPLTGESRPDDGEAHCTWEIGGAS